MDDIDAYKRAINRARHHASTSAHHRGEREVVIIDRADLDALAAIAEDWVTTIEAARKRRAPGSAGCADG